MPDFLRSIAVTVDEPDPGSFYWVLMESGTGAQNFRVLRSAGAARSSYESALSEGVNELRRLCEDRDLGPRRHHDAPEDNPSGWTPLN
jgi:hypothetical protein